MLNQDFKDIISAFNAARVEYLLVGGYAVAAHGLPRATGDIDLWIRPTPENAQRAWQALADFGAPMERVSLVDLCRPDTVLQFGVVPGRIDIVTSIEAVEFDDAWAAHLTVRLGDVVLPVIGRDHLLRNKRAVGRPQDLADVARLEERQVDGD
ncbi:MAG: hypothetical protein ABJF01_23600 [bacterium]